MRKLVYVGLATLVAGAALAVAPDAVTAGAGAPAGRDAIGSVISSFFMSGIAAPYALGIYRDASYVYGIFYSPHHIRKFTPAGSMVSTHPVSGLTVPRGADHAHLGSGYVAIADNSGRKVGVFAITGGSPVTTFSVSGVNMNVAWDGTYYYSNAYTNRGTFYRYTSTGGSAGTWTAVGFPMSSCGAVGFTTKFNGVSGAYIICCSWTSGQATAAFNKTGGSLVRSWTLPPQNSNGSVGGPSTGAFGEVYWCNRYVGGALYAMEVDLNNITPSVAPTSLGKVKSLFR